MTKIVSVIAGCFVALMSNSALAVDHSDEYGSSYLEIAINNLHYETCRIIRSHFTWGNPVSQIPETIVSDWDGEEISFLVKQNPMFGVSANLTLKCGSQTVVLESYQSASWMQGGSVSGTYNIKNDKGELHVNKDIHDGHWGPFHSKHGLIYWTIASN